MPTDVYREVLYHVQQLTDDERLQLLADLAIMLRSQIKAEPKYRYYGTKGAW
jgi:hypothetical protein